MLVVSPPGGQAINHCVDKGSVEWWSMLCASRREQLLVQIAKGLKRSGNSFNAGRRVLHQHRQRPA